jgi:hypothetical protein
VENEKNFEENCNGFAAKETQTSVKKSDIAEINNASGKKIGDRFQNMTEHAGKT